MNLKNLLLLIVLKFKMKACFFRLLFKKGGKRAAWEYPFAVAGINVSFMLIQTQHLYTIIIATQHHVIHYTIT